MLKVGDSASFSKTISEVDVYQFAGITGDFNPIHIDEVYAKDSFFKKRIVHGALVSGLISNVLGMKLPGPGCVYLEQNSKYLRPAYIGDTLTVDVVVEKILNEDKGIIRLQTRVLNQNHELILDGYAVIKVYD